MARRRFRGAYNHGVVDPDTGEMVSYQTDIPSDTRTKQSMKDDCDVNMIVARFKNGESITHVTDKVAQYADVSEVGDYREALENVRITHSMFMELSAEDRAKFDNDPALFLDAVHRGEVYDFSERAAKPHAEKNFEEGVSPIVDTENPSSDPSPDA
jgi:hypothetical protein